MDWFKNWHLTATIADTLLSLALNVVAAGLAFLAALYFPALRSLFGERRLFCTLLGASALRDGRLTITLDVYHDIRLLQPPDQVLLGVKNPWNPDEDRMRRFYKQFPDGHLAAFPGAWEELLGFCSARGAMYLADAFSRFLPTRGVRITSDIEVIDKWDGTFINLGSSYSNIKTDHIKKLPENRWLADDDSRFTLPGGNVLDLRDHTDKGIILRMVNPHSPKHKLLVCAGLGEWGTSGAAWYLARHWKSICKRFGKREFAIFVSVQRQSDESAREVFVVSDPSWWEQLMARMRRRG